MKNKILYCILVHNNPLQTLRLLRAIYNSTDQFVIHADQSAAPEYRALMQAVGKAFPDITVISNHVCSWGGFSLVEAERDMILKGLEQSGAWTHAVMLSGAHLPVWPVAKIRDWMAAGKSFMICHKIPRTMERPPQEGTAKIWDRFGWDYEEVPARGMKRLGRGEPLAFEYAKGSQWIVLARDHAAHAVGPGADALKTRLARTAIADEAFFQTIIMNSDFKENIIWQKTTHAVWGDGPVAPAVFDLAAYLSLGRGSGVPFIRKFPDNLGDERKVENAIDTLMGGVEQPEFMEKVFAKVFTGMLT